MNYYNENKKTKYKLENSELIDKFGIMIGSSHTILTKMQLENLNKTFLLIYKVIKK